MPLDYQDSEVERLVEQMRREGFTQEGVDEIYRRLGLGQAPRVPAALLGNRPGSGRAGGIILDSSGNRVGVRTGEVGDFLNLFGRQAVDPYREYGLGNYLGLAGLLVGGYGAAGGFNGATAAGEAAGAAGGASSTAGGAGSGLGIFSNGGANGLAGLGGGNAGALAASGGIAGGAGIGGTTAGALGGLGALTGTGNGMGWDWGDLVDLGGDILGGWLEADGARDASRAQVNASNAAIGEQRRQYDTTRADLMPWLEAGRGALGRLNDPGANFAASPDYEFRRNEGMRGIENSFAARGGAASGNALRALNEFNSGNAAAEYGNWWNRQAGLAGVGQTTAQNLGAFGSNTANGVSNALINRGDARASGIAGQTNAYSGLLQNLLSGWGRRNQLVG